MSRSLVGFVFVLVCALGGCLAGGATPTEVASREATDGATIVVTDAVDARARSTVDDPGVAGADGRGIGGRTPNGLIVAPAAQLHTRDHDGGVSPEESAFLTPRPSAASQCTTSCDCPLGTACNEGACLTLDGFSPPLPDAEVRNECAATCQCPRGDTCNGGICVCANGLRRCDSACVDTLRDAANCGRCGNACGAGQSCIGGACVSLRCADHCQCAAGQLCRRGACVAGVDFFPPRSHTCFADCQCPAGQRCQGAAPASRYPGDCVPLCSNPGETQCGVACVDTRSNAAHCGRCGSPCASSQQCVAGACVTPPPTPCAAGLTRCASLCVNTHTDSDHCGACTTACDGACVDGRCRAVTPPPRNPTPPPILF